MFNPWTGLYHYPDGHREAADGGVVGGVNNWIGTGKHPSHTRSSKKKHSHKKHRHLTQAKATAKGPEEEDLDSGEK
jgi:hypothetical protein